MAVDADSDASVVSGAEGLRPGLEPDAQVWSRFFDEGLDLFCIADHDGYFRYLSKGWTGTLGWSETELRRVPYLEFVHPEDKESTIKAAGRLAGKEDIVLFENRFRCKDGRYVSLLWNSITDEDRNLVYATARDITRLTELEEARIRLFRMAGHDLAAPVTALRLRLAVLENKGAADAGEITTLGRLVRRLQRLTADVQAAAALEHEDIPVHAERMDIRTVTEDVVAELQHAAEKRGIRLQIEGPNLEVHADSHRIGQVIYNLVYNSLKFSAPGSTTTVVIGHQDDEVLLHVEDEGRGMSKEEQGLLFQPFVQVSGGNGSPERGTGLGLYICRRIAEAHGGRIEVRSEGRGKGATFTVRIPHAAS